MTTVPLLRFFGKLPLNRREVKVMEVELETTGNTTEIQLGIRDLALGWGRGP